MITHRASTHRYDYIKDNGKWYKKVYQMLPQPHKDYELVISPQHQLYLDKIAVEKEKENA